ncbi:MAG: shikimate kinase [Lentisphaeria bacterium]|nr:shikimate kinase [Lentisphaeria bacterium]
MSDKLKCGLIGKTLGHSYSPQIHGELGDYDYSLFELAENELGGFVRSDKFHGANVTIPYKIAVIPYLDEISPEAARIGSVNTIVHTTDGKLKGYNTDYYGFGYMLDSAGISVSGKKVLVLGSGGASLTVRTLLSDRGAKEVVVISRSGENNYSNIHLHADTDVIVNTTPVGMYPNNGTSPVSLDTFAKLSGVADIIFNPSKTRLILDAEARGIKCAGGLSMLVAQAKAASEYFTGKMIDDGEIKRITEKIGMQMKNIALVGMPGCGKSTVGKVIAEKTGREFVDLDAVITEKAGMPIPEIFAKYGEPYFRDLETVALAEVAKRSGLVIATGGGTVIKEENRRLLKQNSTTVFIKRDIANLPKDGRPVSQASSLADLYKVRLPFYLDAADLEAELSETPGESAKIIMERVGL